VRRFRLERYSPSRDKGPKRSWLHNIQDGNIASREGGYEPPFVFSLCQPAPTGGWHVPVCDLRLWLLRPAFVDGGW